MGVLVEVGEGGLSVEVEGQEGACPVFWTCLEMTAKEKRDIRNIWKLNGEILNMHRDLKQKIPWVSLWD